VHAVAVTRRPAPGEPRPLLHRVAHLLECRGLRVTLLHPDPGRPLPVVEADLCVLKLPTGAAVRFAATLEDAGSRVVNPVAVTTLLRDKLATARTLGRAGLPVPETWPADDLDALAARLAHGPLVLKPRTGSQGRGVRVVRDRGGLPARPDPGLLAQRHHPPAGPDHKLYRIGHDLFRVDRRWPAVTAADKRGVPGPVTADLAFLARAVGDVLGTDLYGVDVIESGGRLLVVDVSAFPGFKGVPHADARLAAYLLEAAHTAAPVAAGGRR
jgi:ribosomal protein S6--L-glutamate ligase